MNTKLTPLVTSVKRMLGRAYARADAIAVIDAMIQVDPATVKRALEEYDALPISQQRAFGLAINLAVSVFRSRFKVYVKTRGKSK